MEQLDIQSYDLLELVRDNADEIIEEVGSLETDEEKYIFCQLGEEFFELYYSETDISHIRHLADEDKVKELIEIRQKDFHSDDFESEYFFEEE